MQRGAVIAPLVAKKRPKCVELVLVLHERCPIIVTDLMPEVRQKRAIRLLEQGAPAFALDVICFVAIRRGPRKRSFLRASSLGIMVFFEAAAQGFDAKLRETQNTFFGIVQDPKAPILWIKPV